jgi:hypothetical protein
VRDRKQTTVLEVAKAYMKQPNRVVYPVDASMRLKGSDGMVGALCDYARGLIIASDTDPELLLHLLDTLSGSPDNALRIDITIRLLPAIGECLIVHHAPSVRESVSRLVTTVAPDLVSRL